MREERTVSALQRILGLAMVAAGISSAAVQLAKGGAPARAGQASLATAQAAALIDLNHQQGVHCRPTISPR